MNLKQSILSTLIYHDIFSYPLTREEIQDFLIESKSKQTSINNALKQLEAKNIILKERSYFCLKDSKSTAKLRVSRQKYSELKMQKAFFFAKLLKIVPTIRLVAISGALAMGNSTKNDDIDLVIFTSPNSLWTTRLMANLVLLPYKRSPDKKFRNDKACLNLFISEANLKILDENLYTAHEICQMKPIWDRNNTYQRFLKSNSWTSQYLPNWQTKYQTQRSKRVPFISPLAIISKPLETIAKWCQLAYMSNKITTEKVRGGQLFFHPQNTQKRVLESHQKKLSKLDTALA